MEKLKLCPFCGAGAFVWKTNHHVYIQCSKFNAANDSHGHMVRVSADTYSQAAELWNERKNCDRSCNGKILEGYSGNIYRLREKISGN